MSQSASEQRQSSRFSRQFLVTDYEDIEFTVPFEGFDVNLTGLSFWVDEQDLFYPQQLLSLRVKNLETDEVYGLEAVEVIHLREHQGRFICGCHITHVTSPQLLAHHRIVTSDAKDAFISMAASQVSEFNFVEDGSPISNDQADYQQAGMALNLAVSQMHSGRRKGQALLAQIQESLDQITELVLKEQLKNRIEAFSNSYQTMTESTIALGMLAKLLAHTPDQSEDKQAWKTMIADYENRFLTEEQQIAYDFMHQGLNAEEALEIAEKFIENE